MSGRVKAHLSTVVNRTAEDVFEYIVDVSKHAEWSPKAYRVEGIDGPVQLGSTLSPPGSSVPSGPSSENRVDLRRRVRTIIHIHRGRSRRLAGCAEPWGLHSRQPPASSRPTFRSHVRLPWIEQRRVMVMYGGSCRI